ncbi:DUF2809 domain-containing protein [Paenibacillus sp. NPDC056579]|uniref:ribosomal maturation YjgA family protein n=1 Tax=unclassified Paenibacillus TaxID=185978 RepID=UPI001EF92638|nr:DUF2809 domain-containing protein [Paenibacillus sp. H1-7]
MHSRLRYAAAVVITMALGLGSRKGAALLPHWIAEHAGDMLWAAMVYFGFRVLLVKSSLSKAAGWSLLFSFAIEFSQLYQAEWIQEVRSSLLGSLILGRGFLWIDLARYAVGIAVAFLIDKRWIARNRQ